VAFLLTFLAAARAAFRRALLGGVWETLSSTSVSLPFANFDAFILHFAPKPYRLGPHVCSVRELKRVISTILFVDSREREGGQAGANGRALNDKSDWKANEEDQRFRQWNF
jgi:hypothetical protein